MFPVIPKVSFREGLARGGDRGIVQPMMVKIYWFFRIVAYVTTLGGAIWLFARRTSDGGQEGLYAMGVGFLSFVISYSIYFCLRFCRDRRGP